MEASKRLIVALDMPDMEAVKISVGADDDFIPAQRVQVEAGKLLVLGTGLYAAAEDLNQIRDNLAFKNFGRGRQAI